MTDSETIARLEAKIHTLETRLQVLEDIEEIKKLQRIYGYYLDKALWDELVDLFAEDGSLELAQRGVYVGKASIRKVWSLMPDARDGLKYGMLMNHMNLQGVVHIDPGGKTAKGRWRAFMQQAKLGERAHWGEGVYENEYVKEEGVWKFKKIHWYTTFITPYDTGWHKEYEHVMPRVNEEVPPDLPPTEEFDDYPSVYIPPFHYKHPVTGR